MFGWTIRAVVAFVLLYLLCFTCSGFVTPPPQVQQGPPGTAPVAGVPRIVAECGPRGTEQVREGVTGERRFALSRTLAEWQCTLATELGAYGWFRSACDASWLQQGVDLCTPAGTHVAAFVFLPGTLAIEGVATTSYDRIDPRWNCHGDTFAGGDYRIDIDQVPKILDDEFTCLGRDPAELRAGDIVVYWERAPGGAPCPYGCDAAQHAAECLAVHSAQVIQGSPQVLTFGKRGLEPYDKEVSRPADPSQPDAAWTNPSTPLYYRRRVR